MIGGEREREREREREMGYGFHKKFCKSAEEIEIWFRQNPGFLWKRLCPKRKGLETSVKRSLVQTFRELGQRLKGSFLPGVVL